MAAMSRTFSVCAFAAAVLAAVLAVPSGNRLLAQATEDPQKGAALMAEARKAIGGDDKLRAVKTLQSKGVYKRSAGNNTQEGDVEVLIELPNKYRRNELSGFAGGPTQERVEVLNGDDVWDINAAGGGFGGFGRFGGGRRGDGGFGGGGGGFRGQGGQGGGQAGQAGGAQAGQGGRGAIDPVRLKELQRRQRQTELARLTLLWLLTTDQPVVWVGTAQSPEGNADVLEVKAQDGPSTRIFLDQSTHMPLMMTTQAGGGRGGFNRRGGGPDGGAPPAGGAPQGAASPADGPRRGGQGGQPITIETHLSEYKTVSGIKLPHLITRGVNGQTNEEWEIKSFKINPGLKGNTFTK
jgi:outer membrane lipoprotein-sorting protein